MSQVGPTVETKLTCRGCVYREVFHPTRFWPTVFCQHPEVQRTSAGLIGDTWDGTPDWCPAHPKRGEVEEL